MNRLVRFFVDRSLMTNIIIVAILALAVQTLLSIQKEGFPQVAMNTVVIRTLYPGASAIDVESSITIPIEEALDGVSGISDITSSSKENMSVVTVEADDSASAKVFEQVFDDVKQAVDSIDDFPTGLNGRPVLKQVKSTDQPIVEIGITGPYSTLKTFVPKLKQRLRQVAGAAQIRQLGMPDEELTILIDMNKARQYAVGIRSIAKAIQNRNLEGTVGAIESYKNKKKVVIYNKVNSHNEILNTVVRMSAEGHGIKLKQVATIALAAKETNLIVRTNGAKGASLQVINKADADIVTTIDDIKAALSTVQVPADIKLALLNDKSEFTRGRLKLLGSNALFGFGLVLLLLYLTFGAKVAFWTAFGIPFSVLGAILTLPLLGATFNALSIGGFVLVLGMLVDDAIVVAEQVSKLREEGKSAKEAAALGVAQIWKPVFASALTTIIAFSPLIYLGGLPGKFIWVIPAIVMLALIFSLIESYFFLPTHLSHVKQKKISKSKFMLFLEQGYRTLLVLALKFRYVFFVGALAVLAVAGFTAKTKLVKEPFPQEGSEQLTVQVTLAPGSSLQRTEDEITKIESLVQALPKHEIIGYASRIGSDNFIQTVDQGTTEHAGILIVYLTPFGKRTRIAQTIVDHLRGQIKNVVAEDVRVIAEIVRVGPPIGRAFEIEVASNDERQRLKKIAAIKTYLSTVVGVLDIGDDIVHGQNELILKVNEERLAETGLTVNDVLTTYRIALGGLVVTKKTTIAGTTDYRLRLDGHSRSSVASLAKMQIMNARGRLINFGQLMSYTEVPAIGEQRHLNGRRTNVVYGNIDKSVIGVDALTQQLQAKFPSSEAVGINYAGESEDNEQIFGGLIVAGLLALVGTYLVIAVILNSLFKPFIVMSVVPFGAAGVIFTLFGHGMPISMFAMISLIGLTGIIVNGSILMLYTIAKKGKEKTSDSIIEGATSRLRPILLTTMTTFGGLMPTAYGAGGYDFFISPMCLTMGWGLLLGTVAVLFLVPLLSQVGDDLSRFGKAFTRSFAQTGTAVSFLLACVLVLTSAPAEASEASMFELSQTREIIKKNPQVLEAKEAEREVSLRTMAVDGQFDGRFEVATTGNYSETEANMFRGFSGEEKRGVLGLNLRYDKQFKNGLRISPRLKLTHLELDQGNALPARAGSPQIPSEVEQQDVSAGLRITVPLGQNFANRQYGVTKEIRSATERIQSSESRAIGQQVQKEVIVAYWDAYVKKKAHAVAISSLERARAVHASNIKKYRIGIIFKSELILSDLNVSGKKSALIRAQIEWKESLAKLKRTLHQEVLTDIKIVTMDLSIPEQTFLPDSITLANPTFAKLNTYDAITAQQLRLNQIKKKDQIAVFFDVQMRGADQDFDESASLAAQNDKPTYQVGISWTFQPQQTSLNSDHAALVSQRKQIQHKRKNLTSTLMRLQESTRARLEMAKKLLSNLNEIGEKRRQLVEEQQKEFRLGRITTKLFLDSQELLDASRIEDAKLVSAWNLTLVNYLATIGQLDHYYDLVK